MEIRGRRSSFQITDTIATSSYVSIRVDDSMELAFWMDLCLTETDLRELLYRIDEQKKGSQVANSDERTEASGSDCGP